MLRRGVLVINELDMGTLGRGKLWIEALRIEEPVPALEVVRSIEVA